MPRNKLKALEARRGEGKLFDGAGLYLLKRNPETGRWIFRYKINGRSREMGLGAYPAVSLAEARIDRDKWEAVLRTGRDPIAARDQERADAEADRSRTDPTFEEAAQITFEAKKAGLRGEGAAGRWLSPLKHHLFKPIGKRRMSELHQSDLHAALTPIWRSMPPTAEKAIQRTEIVFRHMKMSGVDCDPFTVQMAKHMLGEVSYKPTPVPASRWQDIPDVWDKLSGDHPSHLALRFKILTAVRSDGIRGARFDEIDGDIWTVPAERMKGRVGKVQDFRVPLSAPALEIVERARMWLRSDFIFPGQRGGGVSDVAINKVFKKADPNGTPHGLRTSFRTWVQDTDAAPYDVAEAALAHIVGGKVERAYARSDLLDRRRLLMDAWANYVTRSSSADVVPLSRGF